MYARGLGPVIEAMWREGMRYHEIAEVFDISCESVHRLIRGRVALPERAARTPRRLEDGRSAEERLLQGMRKAASVLAEGPAIEADERSRAQAVVGSWLASHGEPTAAPDAGSASAPLSPADLRGELDRFEAELRAGGLRESTIHAYLLGSSLFVRWLAGDYVPGPRRAARPPAHDGPLG